MVCNELHNKSLESISFGSLSVHLWHLNCVRVLLRNFTWLSLEKKIEYSFFVVYFVLDMRERWSCIWNPPFDKTEPNCYNSQYFGTQSKKKNLATTVYLFRVNVNKLNIRGVLKELLSFFLLWPNQTDLWGCERSIIAHRFSCLSGCCQCPATGRRLCCCFRDRTGTSPRSCCWLDHCRASLVVTAVCFHQYRHAGLQSVTTK